MLRQLCHLNIFLMSQHPIPPAPTTKTHFQCIFGCISFRYLFQFINYIIMNSFKRKQDHSQYYNSQNKSLFNQHLSHTSATSIQNFKSEAFLKQTNYAKQITKKQQMLSLYRDLLKQKKTQYASEIQRKKNKYGLVLGQLRMLIENEKQRNKNLQKELEEEQNFVAYLYTQKQSVKLPDNSSKSISFALSLDESEIDS